MIKSHKDNGGYKHINNINAIPLVAPSTWPSAVELLSKLLLRPEKVGTSGRYGEE
jgi:hypothetical protein